MVETKLTQFWGNKGNETEPVSATDTQSHREQLRLMIRRYDQVMLTYQKAARSMGQPFERPEDPLAIAAARAELKAIRLQIRKAKQQAMDEADRARLREQVKQSMSKRSDYYLEQRKAWAEQNKDRMRMYSRDHMRRVRQAKKDEDQRPELSSSTSFEGAGVFQGLYSAFGIGGR